MAGPVTGLLVLLFLAARGAFAADSNAPTNPWLGPSTKVSYGAVRNAAAYAGADAGAMIQAAIDDLPNTGGIVDASALPVPAVATAPLVLSKPGTRILLPQGQFTYKGPGIANGFIQIRNSATAAGISCATKAGITNDSRMPTCVLDVEPSSGTTPAIALGVPGAGRAAGGLYHVEIADFEMKVNDHVSDGIQVNTFVTDDLQVHGIYAYPAALVPAGGVPTPYTKFAGASGWFVHFSNPATPGGETDVNRIYGNQLWGFAGAVVDAAFQSSFELEVAYNHVYGYYGGCSLGAILIPMCGVSPNRLACVRNWSIHDNGFGQCQIASGHAVIEVNGSGLIYNNHFEQNDARKLATPNGIADISACNSIGPIEIFANDFTGGEGTEHQCAGATPCDPDYGVVECASGTTPDRGYPTYLNIHDNHFVDYGVAGTGTQPPTQRMVSYSGNMFGPGNSPSSKEAVGEDFGQRIIGPLVMQGATGAGQPLSFINPPGSGKLNFRIGSQIGLADNGFEIAASTVPDGDNFSNPIAGFYSSVIDLRKVARLAPYAVSALPACGADQDGFLARVTDQVAACAYGLGPPAGGGRNKCLVYCDGGGIWKDH